MEDIMLIKCFYRLSAPPFQQPLGRSAMLKGPEMFVNMYLQSPQKLLSWQLGLSRYFMFLSPPVTLGTHGAGGKVMRSWFGCKRIPFTVFLSKICDDLHISFPLSFGHLHIESPTWVSPPLLVSLPPSILFSLPFILYPIPFLGFASFVPITL